MLFVARDMADEIVDVGSYDIQFIPMRINSHRGIHRSYAVWIGNWCRVSRLQACRIWLINSLLTGGSKGLACHWAFPVNIEAWFHCTLYVSLPTLTRFLFSIHWWMDSLVRLLIHLDESASFDGCSWFEVLFRVVSEGIYGLSYGPRPFFPHHTTTFHHTTLPPLPLVSNTPTTQISPPN